MDICASQILDLVLLKQYYEQTRLHNNKIYLSLFGKHHEFVHCEYVVNND